MKVGNPFRRKFIPEWALERLVNYFNNRTFVEMTDLKSMADSRTNFNKNGSGETPIGSIAFGMMRKKKCRSSKKKPKKR